MKLYTYFRSSAAYRVRIALALKGLTFDAVPVHLLRDGGEQLGDSYRAVNPSALVPSLQDGELTLSQSIAIIEYLDQTYPELPLLPPDPLGRARVRELALMVACDIHPLANLRVLRYLTETLGVTEDAKNAWYVHWISLGLAALEAHLVRDGRAGRYCYGDTPGMADCLLVPQVFNAERFNVDLTPYPTVLRINAACTALAAVALAHPSRQIDAQ